MSDYSADTPDKPGADSGESRARIDRAMLLAAGLGTRMRPLTNTRPKPLIEVAGRPLVQYALERLREAGVRRVVMNVHWLAEQLEEWAARQSPPPRILISDEREQLLETGGGIRKALALLGTDAPFFVVNTDSIWLDGATPALQRLARAWDDARMDALLLLCPLDRAVGHDRGGDFVCVSGTAPAADIPCPIRRAKKEERAKAPVFTGVYIVHPRLFAQAPAAPVFSMNVLFDRAMARGRLYGLGHEGWWLHVGTPAAIAAAQAAMAAWRERRA